MKFPNVYSLKDIAEIISSEYVGDDNFPVHGMNEIHVVEPGDIVFVDHPKYYDKPLCSSIKKLIVPKEKRC
jgi:UDP-3-O-[3-hydroxymyristoyl] glucosamine N-acyltransferase